MVERTREDDWFLKNEAKLLENARIEREKRERERAERESAEERKRLKDLHFMCCPKCGHKMAEEKLAPITIERCSFCEGVFFDAGELESLMQSQEERKSFLRRLLKI